MEERIADDVLRWYGQFAHGPSEMRDHTTPNFFVQVVEEEISNFKNRFGNIIPECYQDFWRKIGDGRLTEDINGFKSEGYENSFLSPFEISEILQKKTYDWEIYEEFIAKNEIPFFYIGNNSVLVFRMSDKSRVYFPFLDDVYAENFGDFLEKLMENVNFYNEL